MGVVETIRFHLVAQADAAAFLDVDKRFETQFVYRQHGFVRRTLLRADDGAWVSHVMWADRTDADAAWEHQRSAQHAVGRDAMIDSSTIERELLSGHA